MLVAVAAAMTQRQVMVLAPVEPAAVETADLAALEQMARLIPAVAAAVVVKMDRPAARLEMLAAQAAPAS
jgi:hypothetical protein